MIWHGVWHRQALIAAWTTKGQHKHGHGHEQEEAKPIQTSLGVAQFVRKSHGQSGRLPERKVRYHFS